MLDTVGAGIFSIGIVWKQRVRMNKVVADSYQDIGFFCMLFFKTDVGLD